MKFKSNIELQSGLKDSSGAVGTSGQLLSSTGTGVSWASLNGFVPYTGATQNVDLGIYTLLAAKGVFSSSGSANTVEIGHSSGSGIALNITKGGNGEGLYINKTSGSGNAASITGGVTLLSELNLTTDLADDYIASAATWNGKQNALSGTGFVKISGTTISYDNSTYALDSVVVKLTGNQSITGTKTFSVSTATDAILVNNTGGRGLRILNETGSLFGLIINNSSTATATPFAIQKSGATVFSISDAGLASASNGTLIGGTGTTNYIPKYTGASTLGNSLIFDNGTNVGIGTTTDFGVKLAVNGNMRVTNSDARIIGGDISGRVILSNSNTTAYVSINGSSNATPNNIGIITNSAITFNTGTSYSESMRITSGGNVGIGTISPGDKLAIGNGSESINVRITGNNSGSASGSAVNVGISGVTNIAIGNKSAILGGSYDSTALVYWGNGGNLSFNNGSDRMTITNGGNVLVGPATDLGYKFTVSNGTQSFNVVPAGAGVDLYSTGNFAPHYQSDFSWYTGVPGAGTFRMRLDASGNLGIGTVTPLIKFTNSGGGNSSGPTLGSGSVGSQALLSGNGLYGMYSGVSNNGDVWHQVQRNDANAAVYNLLLQPSGGNVLIGTTTDNGHKLRVNGAISADSVALSGNYSAYIATDSSWSNPQTMIPTGVLQNDVTYMISVQWVLSGGSNQPYYYNCAFLWMGASTNGGGGTDGDFFPMGSTHTGGTGSVMSFRSFSGLGGVSSGIKATLNGFPTRGGNILVKATKLQ